MSLSIDCDEGTYVVCSLVPKPCLEISGEIPIVPYAMQQKSRPACASGLSPLRLSAGQILCRADIDVDSASADLRRTPRPIPP